MIKTTLFGRNERPVTVVGLGGEGVLRTRGREDEARSVIKAAIANEITYFDSARVYADSELYLGNIWGQSPHTRGNVFQASKSARRDKAGAWRDLEQTLVRLKTDYLDLWQIHDVRTDADLTAIGARGGALEAFLEARSQGVVRHVGVTGHHDPAILTRAVQQWPVDTVMMPVNPVEGFIGGFLDQTLPAAIQKGIAVIGMKILGAAHYIMPDRGISPSLLIRYALSQDITVAIVGCTTPGEVAVLAGIGRRFEPPTDAEQRLLTGIFKPHARQLAFYRGVL